MHPNGNFVFVRKVEGYGFKVFCDVTSTSATAKLHYIVPSGVTTDAFHNSGFSGDVNLTELTTTTSLSETLGNTIIGSNGRSVQLYVTVSVDKNAAAPDSHCHATGTMTPIS